MKHKERRPIEDIMEDILQQLKINSSQPIYPPYQIHTQEQILPIGLYKCSKCGMTMNQNVTHYCSTNLTYGD